MSLLKSGYRVFRSMIMSLIVLLVLIYAGLYVVLSLPSVQDRIRERVSREASLFLGGTVRVGQLKFIPFSEVVVNDVSLDSPDGERCAAIGKIAAGIDVWTLLSKRKIVLNYAEIIGLDVNAVQAAEDAPLNIQFLIDALASKDKDESKDEFNLRIRNIVVRDSRAAYRRTWMAHDKEGGDKFADIEVKDLKMDLSIPEIRNNLFRFDVRNIQFEATPGISVRNMSANVTYVKNDSTDSHDRLSVKNFKINLPNSHLTIGDVDLKIGAVPNMRLVMTGMVTPSDLSSVMEQLATFDTPWNVEINSTLKDRCVQVAELRLCDSESSSSVSIEGELKNLGKRDSLDVILSRLDAELASKLLTHTVEAIPEMSAKGKHIIESLGKVSIQLTGRMDEGENVSAQGTVGCDIGRVDLKNVTVAHMRSKRPHLTVETEADCLELNRLLDTDKVGKVSGVLEAEVVGLDKSAEGIIDFRSDEAIVMGNLLNRVDLKLEKSKDDLDVYLEAMSEKMRVNMDGSLYMAGIDSQMEMDVEVKGLNPAELGVKGRMADCELATRLRATVFGNNIDNLTGWMELSDLSIRKPDGRHLSLSELTLSIDSLASSNGVGAREVLVNCDWLDARISGQIYPSTLATELKSMVACVFPTLMGKQSGIPENNAAVNDFEFDINIKGAGAPYAFFDTPIRPLTDIPVKGSVDASHGKSYLSVSTPHFLQGKAKLIRDFDLHVDFDAFLGMAKVYGGLIFPAKKGDAELKADIFAVRDKVNVNMGINPTLDSSVKGSVGLSASFSRVPDPFNPKGELGVNIAFLPSVITVNDKAWTIADGGVDYAGNHFSVSNFLISHDNQYVKIYGTASESADDFVKVELNDIDLDYIFGILNINYVSFGGMATGEVSGNRLLTKTPEARTEFLRVKDLSYNGTVLGDGDLASEYDAARKRVGIYAVIRDHLTRERRLSVDGGIWITRDSLSFDFDADRVNTGIIKPFVSAFCSDISGEASGKCKLYGTFSDIDLVGNLKADTLSMKLDFTNTWYHAGGDSLYLHEGVIEIPPLTLYDDEKHTAEFSGWLRHRYFHDPVFNFRVRDADKLLCYDTNESLNPLWYGTIFGSGNVQINGYPGLIEIDMNMTTEEGSKFYYIIRDAEDVAQYSFLTFTDKRKELKDKTLKDSIPDYLKKFRKESSKAEAGSSNVVLSLKGTVTNDALVTLVMDPRAGDNITARGQGALQMDYNLANADLRIIGTYMLDEGNYNFTLQDIIIKNFNIRKGSVIKFDGDPMKANLDIAATYRVNTNLTDLDKSFATDKELNRTNVPVDAVLLVNGPMTNPDITFDIELPSLTSDVERKVKSIVSTNDMMSRQIIYLLALNRFYTPEYTGGQSNGSEWSSMASSTISSQLSNILSQMTDKLDLAPSFRSEKGDFSDMEFDLALSSRLLNNRLLINGNFGYRDRSTSNTQFVGDFDIEYLLSKNGNLRLKAYNHFNDQNYYLRSALTTQGVGVVFRKDFDRLLRKRKEMVGKNEESGMEETPERSEEDKSQPEAHPADSVRSEEINNNI